MDGESFDVVFRGRIQEGKSAEEVRSNLSEVFKNDNVNIDRFFAHVPLIIKRGVRLKTALGLMETFMNAGLDCELRPSDGSLESPPKGGPPEVEAAPEGMLICPKCGYEQQKSSECVRCGVIFSKFIRSNPCRVSPGVPEVLRGPITYGADSATSRVGILLVTLLVVAFGAYRFWMSLDIRYPPGILVNSVPRQTIIQNPHPWIRGKRVIVPLAEFSLKARVLGKERYRYDAGADICPVDLALGWGPMSDQGILDSLDIVQGNRRYVVAPLTERPPLPVSLLMVHSSNMHMIPADEEIGERLTSIRVGEVIRLEGYLVGIQEGGQWTWVSSLTRNDTGDGACELVWVRMLQTLTGVQPSADITSLDSRRIIASQGAGS